TSYATNLVPGDTNGFADIFIRDRLSGTTERVSVGAGAAQANAESLISDVSADGRYVSFTSPASNLVDQDTNGAFDVFVRDRLAKRTYRVSLDIHSAELACASIGSTISADGRYVAFATSADVLATGVPGCGSISFDGNVYVRDRTLSTTTLVSILPT